MRGRVKEEQVRREAGKGEKQERNEQPAQEDEHGVGVAEAPEQMPGNDIGKAGPCQEDEDIGGEKTSSEDKGVEIVQAHDDDHAGRDTGQPCAEQGPGIRPADKKFHCGQEQ